MSSQQQQGALVEEQQPINNSLEVGDDVEYRNRKSRGCYVSTGLCICLMLCGLALLALTGLLVGFIVKSDCSLPGGQGSDIAAVSSIYPASTNDLAATVPPGLPWSGIRLPRSIIPTHYQLSVTVDLERFQFRGRVEIEVDARSSTKYVILHVNKLNVNATANHVLTSNDRAIPVVSTRYVPQNQFYVLELRSKLAAGGRYKVVMEDFWGPIQDDLRGMYRSTYKDKDGKKRSVTHDNTNHYILPGAIHSIIGPITTNIYFHKRPVM